MSQGEIISHIGEGKYKVRQKLAVDRINARLAKLNERIAELAVDLPTAKLELLQAKEATKDKAAEIDSLIDDLMAGTEGAREQITKLQTELIPLQSATRLAELKVAELIAENLSVLKRRGQLEAVPEAREITAWCADYTLELAGEVGLVDVNDEGGQGVVIQPGYDGEAAYDAIRDGALFPNLGQSGAQIFFNAAILPGVQKWMPRYRVGELINLQSDLCDVRLDHAQSSAQDLPINQAELLSGVPIVYMDCNGSAFTEGDRVIVRFTANGPLVIGFESDPVPCSLFGFVFEPARWKEGSSPTYKADKEVYGSPFDDFGVPINPPLGSINGSNNAWTAIPDAGNLDIQRDNPRNYGNKNWFNKDKLVLSWAGPPGRAHRMDQFDSGFSGFQAPWKTSPYVYHNLTVILDLSTEAAAGAFVHVFGASVYEDVGGQRWLVVVASDTSYAPGQTFKAFRITVDELLQPFGLLQLMDEITLMPGMEYQSHFYFSDDGMKAVCTIVGDLADNENLHIDLVRFDVSSGFSTEQIWSRNQSIGTKTTVHTWVVQEDTPSAGATTTQASRFNSYNAGSHTIPIYCEYVGSKEVIAYESWPASNSVSSADYDKVTGTYAGAKPAPVTQWTAGETSSESQTGTFAVITDDGRTLYKSPESPNRETSLSYDSYQQSSVSWEEDGQQQYQPGTSHFRVSNSENARVGGIDWNANILAIDIRFEFCAVAPGGYEYTKTESVDTTYESSAWDGSFIQATGTIGGNEIVETMEVWQRGTALGQEPALNTTGPVVIGSFSSDPFPRLGISGSNSSETLDVAPRMPLKIGSKHLMTAAAYRSGPHTLAAVSMNYPVAFNDRELVTFNYVSGFTDPVSEIIERSEASDYLFCSLGLI